MSSYATPGLSARCLLKTLPVLQRLSRAVRHIDDRVSVPRPTVPSHILTHRDSNPPIAQFVFYQSGVGAANNIYSRLIDGGSIHHCQVNTPDCVWLAGATGASLGTYHSNGYAARCH